jgi:formate dehydrogenase (coenzyme F420) beta subunit
MCAFQILRFDDGEVLTRFRAFLSILWERAGFQALLAPVDLPGGGVGHQVIEQSSGLQDVNPFTPFMPSNIAGLVDDFRRQYPEGRLAVIMRPCELRTLAELAKRRRLAAGYSNGGSPYGDLITIGVDCAGTYPAGEYNHRLAVSGQPAVLYEVLSSGCDGISGMGRLRSACQLCTTPAPKGSDLTIGTLGAAPFRWLLVGANSQDLEARLLLMEIGDGEADLHQARQRDRALESITQERAIHQAHLFSDPGLRIGDLSGLLACLSRCTLCADCLDACPLYEGELSGMLGVGSSQSRQRPLLSELIDVSRWLASCSVCGMCHEACTNGVNLLPLIAILSQRIREGLGTREGDPILHPY